MRKFWIGCICLIAAASLVQAANLYRWLDADGNVHYTDTPPPQGAKQVEQKRFGASVIDSSELSYSVQQAAKNFPVTLYANDCDVCIKARKLLEKRGIPYDTKGVESVEDQVVLKQVTGGALEAPVLTVGKTVLRGFEEGQWNRALDEAGYPQTVVKPTKPVNKPQQPMEQQPAAENAESVLRNFEEGQWNRALDEAGFPQTVVKPANPADKQQ